MFGLQKPIYCFLFHAIVHYYLFVFVLLTSYNDEETGEKQFILSDFELKYILK